MRLVWLLSIAAALLGCSPQASAPIQAPPQAPPAKPSAWRQVEPQQQQVPLVPDPAGVPTPPSACASDARTQADCTAGPSARESLATALESADLEQRDARLLCLESSPEFAPGLIRALRAELAPLGCADVLAMPFLSPRRAELERSVEDTLIALSAAARLSRLVQNAPAPPAGANKARFMDFFRGALKPWIVAQASAIHDLSAIGPRLTPYAKGVVAIEAGLADMRFVKVVRQVPLPQEMSDDPELREAYYAALDEALEPRKARGRDAALVGLREFASVGILNDPRLERARSLLSEVYAGHRINALDQLLLAPIAALPEKSVDQRLAARLPTYYAGILLAQTAIDSELLRALLERGLPRAREAELRSATLDAVGQDLLVRALLERGRRYFRAEDFAEATRLSAAEPQTPERALHRALGSALEHGPRDASELLLSGPKLAGSVARVSELDLLAAQHQNPSAALAAFDAAYLLQLAPPANDVKFWNELARRFDLATAALREPAQKKTARELALAAKDTAKALARDAAKNPR